LLDALALELVQPVVVLVDGGDLLQNLLVVVALLALERLPALLLRDTRHRRARLEDIGPLVLGDTLRLAVDVLFRAHLHHGLGEHALGAS
jgi:hypothetical protein